MLSVRAELEKVNKEKERQRKIAEKDRKAQARLEKKALLAESKKEVEPQPETTPVPINEDEKKDEVVLKDSRREKSGVKSKSIKPEIKSKESKSNKDSLKSSKKDEVKKEKEDRTKMERDKKLKEKEEKEERLKIEKEKKLKEKAEKEEQKQDQIQKEKEERRKQKEDQDKMSKVKENKMEPKPNKPTEQLRTKKQASDDQMKLKNKENTSKHLKTLADEKQKEEAFAKMALVKSERNINKPKEEATVQESTKPKEQPTIKELNINKIKLRKGSSDDLILQLVKIKQAEEKKMKIKPVRLSDLNVSSCTIKAHLRHKLRRGVDCTICEDSELELDMDNVLYNQNREKEPNSIIIGDRILKNRIPYIEKPPKGMLFEPLFFKSQFQEEDSTVKDDKEKKSAKKPPAPIRHTEQETAKGVIRYALSDRSFIDKGWTMLPTEKVVRKMNVYRMRPAHPEFDWFEHNKNKKLMLHDTGEKLAEFDDNGKGRWFYRNGRKALDYYDAEEINAQQRFVIYSNGEPDERGRARPYTILATFDYLGNGIVFDHSGKIRLKYNQTEGVVLDRDIGPVSHWKWHTLNDPPVLQQVMIDTQMAHKDPDILKLGGHGDDKPRNDNEEMLAIEFDNFIKEKSKKLTQKFKPFQIKMKALKINENFSLKVLDQATVYLIFRDGSANLKLNIGMILDHKEIVDTDTAEVGEVSNSLERFPARTDSLAGLQQSVAYAQRIERARLERERRLRPSQSCASADKLTAGASRPLRTPFRTATSNTSTHTTECFCRCRKPSLKNIYYDT
ncbi:titin homolog, partial [Zerene cesonia]|uniref:titin homolog n=1 Tax=Zerene cesonia TaxID=33412 RepID=UPI0018E54A44